MSSNTEFSTRLDGAREYLERKGIIPVYRNPEPRLAPELLRTQTIPLEPPLPLAETQEFLNGEPPPDHGQTLSWPFPFDK